MGADLPRLLFTLGDVAGIGPEIMGKAWQELLRTCRPVVVGDVAWLEEAAATASAGRVVAVSTPDERDGDPRCIPCLQATAQDLRGVKLGEVSAAAGRAAYDFLCRAIDEVMAGRADGIVTAPLHKEGLRAAGLPYPGHTEILAQRTGTRSFGMVLAHENIAVAHVTLHTALRDVPALLTRAGVLAKARLLDGLLRDLRGGPPRLAVAALNPHASDGGLFGDEEARILAPAVAEARAEGMNVVGPLPADDVFARALNGGEFEGIVAMYHDQGHIPLKLLGRDRLVNISVGLPIIRTSVAHGTAYDIAPRRIADPRSLVSAAEVAAKLVRARKARGTVSVPPSPDHLR